MKYLYQSNGTCSEIGYCVKKNDTFWENFMEKHNTYVATILIFFAIHSIMKNILYNIIIMWNIGWWFYVWSEIYFDCGGYLENKHNRIGICFFFLDVNDINNMLKILL